MMGTSNIRCRNCHTINRVHIKKIDHGPKCGRCQEKLVIYDAPLAVTDVQFQVEVLQETLPVLVDFWAPWCGPCKVIAPVLDDLARHYRGRLKIVKINTDQNQGYASQLAIRGIPTMILFQNGREVNRLVGAVPSGQIEQMLEAILK